ncbi:hypothetical protein B0I35DRAFT_209952 [Stachybotrys elegans]|uniref:Uncharacterized protein n=1 Tax=Stachybotrys elegans TaxID=80388 RepID=A0A8K0WSF5_9HYPO|nr:hypothetical protein B0I35DRAFT_209952 [Stachybotrys elegans]
MKAMEPWAMGMAFRLLLFVDLAYTLDFGCKDGSLPSCRDGSVPIPRNDIIPTSNLETRSLCPKSCNVFRNACDPTTAPTCVYPNPRVRNPHAACACRPGYKASNTADGDTQKHWRLPVAGQEHRVWVAEGVKCDALCGGYGAQSCTEVTILGPDCVGDGVAAGGSRGGSFSPGGSRLNETTAWMQRQNSSSAPSGPVSPTQEPDDTVVDEFHSTSSADRGVPTPSESPASTWTLPEYLLDPADESTTVSSEDADFTLPTGSPPRNKLRRRSEDTFTLPFQTQQKAWELYQEQWNSYISQLAGVADYFKIAERPQFCPDIKDTISWTCKRAVEMQNTNCGFTGEARDPHCQTSGLTTDSCAEYVRQTQAVWCNNPWSNANLDRLRSQMQEQCAIITPAARSYLKVAHSIRLSIVLSKVISEGGENVPFLSRLNEVQTMWVRWRRGLQALLEGDIGRGVNLLSEITTTASLGIQTRDGGAYYEIAWTERLEPIIASRVDEFMLKTINMAWDVWAIMRESEYLISTDVLQRSDAGDLLSIQGAARKFTLDLAYMLSPTFSERFDDVPDQATMDTLLEQYKKFLQSDLVFRLVRTWAVVVRVNRVLAA